MLTKVWPGFMCKLASRGRRGRRGLKGILDAEVRYIRGAVVLLLSGVNIYTTPRTTENISSFAKQ